MSITNFINSDGLTIMQGVNGISLCNESWMTQRERTTNKTQQSVRADNKHQEPNIEIISVSIK